MHILFFQVQQLSSDVDSVNGVDEEPTTTEEESFRESRKMLVNIFVEYGRLVKQVNSVGRYAIRMKMERDSEEVSNNIVQNAVLDT